MEFRKRLWLLYLLVTSLKIALTMFVARVNTNRQKISQNGVEVSTVSISLWFSNLVQELLSSFPT